MPAPVNASARGEARSDYIREVNTRYHDFAAQTYDAKWGIDFGAIGIDQVKGKLRKALGGGLWFGDALEIGSGTGYFSLNLLASGVIERATCTDISPGMLAVLQRNAEQLGLEVTTRAADAERLPFEDASFDLVIGHAILHHIPDLDRAAGELMRVLRPGGTAVFCGEPSINGDRLAAIPKWLGHTVAPAWRALVGAPASGGGNGADPCVETATDPEDHHQLESEVDVHAFEPGELGAIFERAGFDRVTVRGEELVANLYGWGLRSVEATADPDAIPVRWRQFAFRSYIALQRLDSVLLEPRLPARLFYNLIVTAQRPR